MSIEMQNPTRAVGVGLITTLALLALVSRPARAAKSTDCLNQNVAVCELVERCSGGFETNGSCKWIYTANRYYWKN